jgi:3-hydroxyacyl-[acyl-carrier-protein] dehydratase
MWIDRIVHFEPEKRLVAVKNVSLAEEHLHDHFPAAEGRDAVPIMPASLMIEGMAQAAGILVGTVNRFREKVILAKINLAEFEADVIPGQTIRYEAELERIDSAGAATNGIVRRLDHCGDETDLVWQTIGRVNLMFSHADQNMAGLEFPDENFVFSDNFRTILRTAGLQDLAAS